MTLAALALVSLAAFARPLAPQERTLTGAVGEAEFKAMHELKQGATPALLGKSVEVAGSKAYLTLPASARPGAPAVIVIHEWWGLNDHVKHWADRLASDGYAALAVDLYGGVVATTSDAAMAAMRKVDHAKAVSLLLEAEKYLRADEHVKAGKVASVGWCFGGGMSLELAQASATLDACVMYYGRFPTEAEKLASLRAPLLGIFGSRDRSIPAADVAAFVDALTKGDKEHRVLFFLAEHAFANPSNPRYEPASAAAAWENVRLFLAEKLK